MQNYDHNLFYNFNNDCALKIVHSKIPIRYCKSGLQLFYFLFVCEKYIIWLLFLGNEAADGMI